VGLDSIGRRIEELTLIPSAGGAFEVTVNDQVVFSKLKLGRHAESGELLPLVREAL